MIQLYKRMQRMRENYVDTIAKLYEYATTAYAKNQYTQWYDTKEGGYTYQSFKGKCDSLSKKLTQYGIGAGDKVAILSQSMPNWSVAFFSIVPFGRIAIPILPDSSAHRPDSQDACFVFPGETFADTLFRRFNGKAAPGNFIYQGKTVGRHLGIHRCTIGQRKGLNVALGVPAYVKSIDPASCNVELVTDQTLLESSEFEITNVNFQTPVIPDENEELLVQIRYRTPPAPGRLLKLDENQYKIVLQTPVRAITPGQSAVLYRGNTLLGGGIIV